MATGPDELIDSLPTSIQACDDALEREKHALEQRAGAERAAVSTDAWKRSNRRSSRRQKLRAQVPAHAQGGTAFLQVIANAVRYAPGARG